MKRSASLCVSHSHLWQIEYTHEGHDIRWSFISWLPKKEQPLKTSESCLKELDFELPNVAKTLSSCQIMFCLIFDQIDDLNLPLMLEQYVPLTVGKLEICRHKQWEKMDGVENPEDLRRLKANLTSMNLTGPKKKMEFIGI